MEELTIKRNINNQTYSFTLTEEELEQAYRIKEKRYRDEDFANLMAQNPDSKFHSGHLEEFPELTYWLCECFDSFFDANMSHNDLLELTLNHLEHASQTPEFFTELASLTPAICGGVEKQAFLCEQDCRKYYHCGNIAAADDQAKRWEELSSMISIHKQGNCMCCKDTGKQCEAAHYLYGEWDISSFFHYDAQTNAA